MAADEFGTFHAQSLEEYLEGLETTRDGLTAAEAELRHQKYGYNEMTMTKAEKKRAKSMVLIPYTSRVVRDGEVVEVDVKELTVGDVIILKAGDKVPADCRVIEGEVKVDNASLTGECEPMPRTPTNTSRDDNYLESTNIAFSCTIVVEGECRAVVHSIGDETVIGRIAGLAYDTREPAGPKLAKALVNQLAEECGLVLKSRAVLLNEVDTIVITPALFAHANGGSEATAAELELLKQAVAEMEEMEIEVHLASRGGKEEVELQAESAGLNHTAVDASTASDDERRDARVLYNCTPQIMLIKVRALVSAQKVVAYAGDGVSDAPSLKTVHIGIGTANCSDVAREASDAIMTKEDPNSLSQAFKLARNHEGAAGCSLM